MEAGKAVDAYGCVHGNITQQADGTSAYTQALLGGTSTWVRLPPDRWPKGWKEKFFDPVIPLRLALYGHPDAGGYWEKHCDSHILSEGFIQVPDWRSVYWHPNLKTLLIVYVDDFKMSGPVQSVAKAWEKLRKGLVIEDPSPAGKFLGCTNIIFDHVVETHPLTALHLLVRGESSQAKITPTRLKSLFTWSNMTKKTSYNNVWTDTLNLLGKTRRP